MIRTKNNDSTLNLYKLKSLVILLIGLFTLQSCEQEFDSFEEAPIEGDISAFFRSVANDSETFQISSKEESFIITEDGTIIQIPAGKLVDADGNVIDGEIELIIDEYDQKSDLIFNKLPSVSARKQLLNSYRILNFTFSQNGTELAVSSTSRENIIVRIPISENEKPNTNISLFGEGSRDGKFAWAPKLGPADQQLLEIAEWTLLVNDQKVSGSGYQFPIVNKDYYNLATVESAINSFSTVCANSGNLNYTDKNTIVFAAYKDLNSILILDYDEAAKLFCEGFELYDSGRDVLFGIIVSLENDKYLFDLAELNANQDKIRTVDLDPIDTSLEDIISFLNEL